MIRALLVGQPPPLDFLYVAQPPYDAVVIGSLTLGQLLCFCDEGALSALAWGLPVYLYTPGLPKSPQNAALAASLFAAQRRLKGWGVIFTDGAKRPLITAAGAALPHGPNPLVTPLARDFLHNKEEFS